MLKVHSTPANSAFVIMLNRYLLPLILPVLLTAFAAAGSAQAAGAGAIVSSSGPATIVSADGKTRSAKPGTDIHPGDKLVTGDKGQVNVKFSDDSVLLLHAQTEFRIDQYSFSGGKADDDKGFFSLLKGGFRTVTGLLGKFNRSAYRVTTPAATIGIRGTEYTARLDNGLHVQVDRGEISLSNKAGAFAVGEGQRAYVADQKSTPKYLNLSAAAQAAAAARGSAPGSGTNIQGNTTINATAKDVSAVAVGQENTASNKIGTIGGK